MLVQAHRHNVRINQIEKNLSNNGLVLAEIIFHKQVRPTTWANYNV